MQTTKKEKTGLQQKNKIIIEYKDKKIKVGNEKDIVSIASLLKKHFPKVRYGKTQLGAFFIVLYLLSFKYQFWAHPTSSMITEIRQAIFGTNMLLVYIGIIVLPKPSIIRPHP